MDPHLTSAIRRLEQLAEELAAHPPEDGDTLVVSGATYQRLTHLGMEAERELEVLELAGIPYERQPRDRTYHVLLDLTMEGTRVWLGPHGRRLHLLTWTPATLTEVS